MSDLISRVPFTTEEVLSIDPEKFWAKVEKTDGCWIWRGATSAKSGYGHVRVPVRKSTTSAHRAAYVLSGGVLIEGWQVDHLCRVRNCVNPEHLELVTARENHLRSYCPSAVNRLKTHCKRGHEFTEENTYWYVNIDPPRRRCRACYAEWNRDWQKPYRARRKAESNA